jgi:hypothetical protein
MTSEKVQKKYVLPLVVLLLFLITNTAIAYHHHGHVDLSHDDCPICATAHVTSFAEHDFSTSTVQYEIIAGFDLIPHERHTFISPLFLTHLNSRAPPA